MMEKRQRQTTNGKYTWSTFISSILFGTSIINLFVSTTYDKKTAVVLGTLAIIISIFLLIRNKNDKKYMLLFGIITYVNLSIFLSDILTNGSIVLPANTLLWQKFRNTQYEIQFLNSLFIFLSTINLIDSMKKDKRQIGNKPATESALKNKNNICIFIMCFGVLLLGLFTGYRNSSISGSYMSATSTLYEYCILFLLLAWYYAGNSKARHTLILIYAAIYSVQALIYGDRSSVFPMILLITILYLKHLSIFKMALFAIAGILASNIVATYRESYNFSNFSQNYIARYSAANFTSDTVSQSYYTGISMFYVRDIVDEPAHYFTDYFAGLILGGGYKNANVTSLAKKYATNKGGGMIVSDFFFWFSYYGVIIEAIIIGLVLAKLKNEKTTFASLWKIYVTVMVFRWYLYGSFVFFRSCMIVFPSIYCLFWAISKLNNRRTTFPPQIIKLKERNK